MPGKCCVPRCTGNYSSERKVHVFSFPSAEQARTAWARAIPRDNFVPSKYSKVCERHFSPDDILRESTYIDDSTGRIITAPLSHVRLRPDAVPSIFPEFPEYVTKQRPRREDPVDKRRRLDALALQKALQDSIVTAKEEREADRIDSLSELTEFVRSKRSTFWHVVESNERLLIVHIVGDESPWIQYSVAVKCDLSVTLNLEKTAVSRVGRSLTVPRIANSRREVMELLEGVQRFDGDLSSCSNGSADDIYTTVVTLLSKVSVAQAKDAAPSLQLLIEQVKLLSTKKAQRHYSADFMIVCCLLYIISPHAYRYLCSHGSIILPSLRTIQSICFSFGTNQQDGSFLSYMAKRLSDLTDVQCYVILSVDEVLIRPFFDCPEDKCPDGKLDSTATLSSALVFMVQSLYCSFKEVAHVSPVHNINGESLHKLIRDVICGLEGIGYRVMCVVTSNSPVKRKAMLHFKSPTTSAIDLAPQKTTTNDFVFPHPCDSQRPLFFVIDPVHILKSVRNNWLKQNNQCLLFPDFQPDGGSVRRLLRASFNTIRDAYNSESELLAQYGYALSKAAVSPTEVEKQNVQVAMQIFTNLGPPALRALGAKGNNVEHCEETANFIEILAKWWTIVSAKSPAEGLRLRDELQNSVFPPLHKPEVSFLYDFLDWLEIWREVPGVCKLSKKTHDALHQTTQALVEIARYCCDDLNMPYVLLGKFQTDFLEHKFGRCRHPVPRVCKAAGRAQN